MRTKKMANPEEMNFQENIPNFMRATKKTNPVVSDAKKFCKQQRTSFFAANANEEEELDIFNAIQDIYET